MADEEEEIINKKAFLFATYGEVLELKALVESPERPFDVKRTDANGFTVRINKYIKVTF